ncbi:MAG: class I SAM-dependent methyltransferase [Bacteroidetes bacterium]|nr:class I SAM-dependent methyltransferase [Bacteroidota bacterium]MBS1609315.1 class I SAM-dependent methyltransferase [Bacteroidota bacterium]
MQKVQTKNRVIEVYDLPEVNLDRKTVTSFGEEWTSFHDFSDADIKLSGDKYFDIVDDKMLTENSVVIDIGCGSGRFIKYLEGRYGKITGIDPSSAIFAADKLLGNDNKIQLIQASTDNIPFPDNHFDFGYSLGVLHHIPDTQKALNDSVRKIKPGGYFLLYLYYSLDNRSIFFKLLFHLSNGIRWAVSKLKPGLKRIICDILAIILYMPFVFFCRFLKFIQVPEKYRRLIPLQAYEQQSFYIIRNDSLDRFGTPLEQRFSRPEIQEMMEKAGLRNIVFSTKIPYWHAVGKKE